MVAAGVVLAAVAARRRPAALVAACSLGLAAAITALAACSRPWQLVIPLAAAGLFITPIQAAVTTVLQTAVAPELRGRVQASFSTVVTAAGLASMAAAGLAADAAGTQAVFLAAALIVAAGGIASLLTSRTPQVAIATATQEGL
jgi:MFS family permease